MKEKETNKQPLSRRGFLKGGALLAGSGLTPTANVSGNDFSAICKKGGGETLYNGIRLPETWPPTEMVADTKACHRRRRGALVGCCADQLGARAAWVLIAAYVCVLTSITVAATFVTPESRGRNLGAADDADKERRGMADAS